MEQLLQELRTGQKDAIKRIYEQSYHHCKWAVLKNKGSEDDARDVFQEAVFSLINRLQEQDVEIKNLDAYLYNSCKFIWYGQLRKNGKVSLVESFNDDIEEEDGLQDKEEKEKMRSALYQGLNKIGEDCRRLIELTFFEKYSDSEIAPIFGYQVKFVRTKRYRCIKMLKRIIGKEFSFAT